MTPDPPDPASEFQIDDADLGEPIAELRDLSIQGNDRFGSQVRSRIERRRLAGEFVSLAWSGPVAVVLELLRVPFELFAGRRRP